MTLEFTGERWIPGITPDRVAADHEERYRFACQYTRDKRVLDIACGAGGGSSMVATDGAASSVQGVDISLETVEYARDQFGSEHVRFDVGRIEEFQTDEPFDVVTCFETIEHVDDDRGAIAALFAALGPGGRLLISTPNRPVTTPGAKHLNDRPANPYHVREYTVPEISDLLSEAGFDVESIWGQRLRLHSQGRIPNGLIKRARKFFHLKNPNETGNTVPRRFSVLSPRYFICVCRKPE